MLIFTFQRPRRKRERKGGVKNLLKELISENFPNLGKAAHAGSKITVPNQMNPKKSTPRHAAIKMAKMKDI